MYYAPGGRNTANDLKPVKEIISAEPQHNIDVDAP